MENRYTHSQERADGGGGGKFRKIRYLILVDAVGITNVARNMDSLAIGVLIAAIIAHNLAKGVR